MDLTRRHKREIKIISSELELYPHDVSLYLLPPTSSITLAEFEDLAVDRLKALRIMENVSLRGINNFKNVDEAKTAAITEFNKEGLKYFSKLMQGTGYGTSDAEVQARRKDHISHFILRLSYCRSEELRRWFAKQEIELFRLRFLALNSDGIKQLLKVNHLTYSPISVEEKYDLRDRLFESTPMLSTTQIDTMDFYRVPYSEVLNLVRQRKCYLNRGYAYIPSTNLLSLVTAIFRANLNEALAKTARLLPVISEDDRLNKMLGGLHHSYTGNDDFLANKKENEVQIKDLDAFSRRSYPLCMRQLHDNLRLNHHLRHGARQVYGLFLKGIGVKLEDALRFWREEFTKKMDIEKFEKQYSYNIRHSYGKEGKQANYTPYSCMKIIMGSLGAGDVHGCPFRHNDLALLKQQLTSYNISQHGIGDIEKYVKGGHFQLACGKYYELVHGQESSGVNHPNQYFKDSVKALAPKDGNSSGKMSSGEMKPPHVPPQAVDEWEGDFDASSLMAQFD